jgi:hypothetical protein
MLDTNAYDEIVARPGFQERLNAAHNAGKVVIVRTHIQEDELASIPDPNKKAAVTEVAGTSVATSGGVFGLSKFDGATFGGGAADVHIGDVATSAGQHMGDALIASSAAAEADVLVTEDRRLPKRVRLANSKLEVWNFEKFAAYVESL